MAIQINLNGILEKRKMGLTELSAKVGVPPANLSMLKSRRARAIRFSTLNEICKVLDCQPGDIFEYIDEKEFRN